MPKVSRDSAAIEQFLARSVENAYPNRDAVAKALGSDKSLTIYAGIDPTGPTLHLGHVIWLKKLAELQKLGHNVIMLVGDFTAMIGDPTDKGAARKRLTKKEVAANCKLYKKQASRFLKFTGSNAAQLKYNSKWLGKMSFGDVVELATHFTVQQLMERDMFKKRMDTWKPKMTCSKCGVVFLANIFPTIKRQEEDVDGFSTYFASGRCPSCAQPYEEVTIPNSDRPLVRGEQPVYLHEFLYPLMQGYDSVAMNVDMEIGGNDQTFNMLAGRTLLREMKKKEKSVVTLKLLTDPSGKKMGKSEGNMVAMTDSAEDMYGKVMSWTDGMIVPAFELVTDVSDPEINKIRTGIANGENPMPYKRQLAKEIVNVLLGEKQAVEAEAHFSRVHQAHEVPQEMPTFSVLNGISLPDALVGSGLVNSKSDARRQIEQGGVKVDGAVVTDVTTSVHAGSVVQKGKRHFVKLI